MDPDEITEDLIQPLPVRKHRQVVRNFEVGTAFHNPFCFYNSYFFDFLKFHFAYVILLSYLLQ